MNEEFFSLAPQMRDYLSETNVYLPYLMHFHVPDIRRQSFTTDEFGFRRTVLGESYLTLQQFNDLTPAARPCALLGNSTAFGVGATHDSKMVSSQLNRHGYGAWFNFSGRTFNPFQEVLAFLMFAKGRVDTAVVLSGINLFDMSYRFATDMHQWVPPFYSERVFFERLGRSFWADMRAWLGSRWNRAISRLSARPSSRFDSGSLLRHLRSGVDLQAMLADSKSMQRALENFDHMLGILQALQPNKIGRLVLALQPVPEWFGRPLTPVENKLSLIVDRHRGEKWRAVQQHLHGHAKEFREAIETLCKRRGIEFVDLNMSHGLLALEWVFIDRYHLTDEAQAKIASILHAVICGKVA